MGRVDRDETRLGGDEAANDSDQSHRRGERVASSGPPLDSLPQKKDTSLQREISARDRDGEVPLIEFRNVHKVRHVCVPVP